MSDEIVMREVVRLAARGKAGGFLEETRPMVMLQKRTPSPSWILPAVLAVAVVAVLWLVLKK